MGPINRLDIRTNFHKQSLFQFPKYLTGGCGGCIHYLHIIHLTINFEKPIEPREKALYDLLQRPQGFGFLTSEAVPKICDFPMYLTVGEVRVNVEMNYACIHLDDTMLQLIKK